MYLFLLMQQSMAAAATGTDVDSDMMGIGLLVRHMIAAVIFAVMGIVVLFVCIWVFDRLSPYSFRKEILEDQNAALGIIAGTLLIGISIIIAAAIHG